MTDLLAEAQLGVEAELFKVSALGRYMNDNAVSEIIEASNELCTVDPTDTKLITSLQNKVYRANSFLMWIESAIESGNFAVDTVRDEHNF